MNHLPYLIALFVIAICGQTTTAHAGDALPELKGTWVAESMDGKPPPAGAKMVMKFMDDQKLRFEVTYEGETELETLKYKATKDGKMTIYFDPEKNPKGDKATWKIVDKKLHLTSDVGETLILKREK